MNGNGNGNGNGNSELRISRRIISWVVYGVGALLVVLGAAVGAVGSGGGLLQALCIFLVGSGLAILVGLVFLIAPKY